MRYLLMLGLISVFALSANAVESERNDCTTTLADVTFIFSKSEVKTALLSWLISRNIAVPSNIKNVHLWGIQNYGDTPELRLTIGYSDPNCIVNVTKKGEKP